MESEGLAYTQDEETPPDLKEVFDVGPTDVPNTEYSEALPRAGTSRAEPPSGTLSTTDLQLFKQRRGLRHAGIPVLLGIHLLPVG